MNAMHPSAPGTATRGWWGPTAALWHRDMVRFVRQRNRVVGALLTPLVFWALLGSGLNRSFSLVAAGTGSGRDVGYLEYFLPGTIVMILLFTAIFSTVSVIEDRREGFLQGVLAAPVSRLSIALGKILGGATLATVQGAIVLLIWPLVSSPVRPLGMVLALLVMFVLALSLTGLGLCLAWPMDSTQGYHAVMNLLLMPMWFLSGALFPLSAAPAWLQVVMYANPLTYGQAVLRAAMSGGPIIGAGPGWLALSITIAFAAAMPLAASWLVARPRRDGLA